MDTESVVPSSRTSYAPLGRVLTPPAPLSQPPPRLTGERGEKQEAASCIFKANHSLFSRLGGGRWEKRAGVMRVLLFSRRSGGRLGEEDRGDKGLGRGRSEATSLLGPGSPLL